MNPPPYADPLEEALSSPSHLEGAAFTAEVTRRLPSRRRGLRAWILAGGGVLAACAAAAILARPAGALGPALLAALGGSVPEGTGIVALLTLAAVALTAAVAAGGELGDDRQRSAA